MKKSTLSKEILNEINKPIECLTLKELEEHNKMMRQYNKDLYV